MVFPTSYLPATSQPWGREVQKRIEQTETTVARNEKNNDARDTQLAAAMDRLSTTVLSANAAATKAQQAVDSILTVEENVYYPGTTEIDGGNIRANTIAANKISAGTLTGFTVNTAASGQRVEVSGLTNSISFYNGNTTGTSGSITGFYDGSNGSSLFIDGPVSGGYLMLADNVTLITGPGTSSIDLSGNNFNVSGSIQALNGMQSYSTISSTGSISTNQGLIRTAYIGGGTTGASFNNDGNLIRTTSSERYKQEIESVGFDYDDVLALQPKKFKLKDEAKDNPDARHYVGFIAEEIAGTPLDIFVAYQTLEDGTKRPDGVYYPELTTALLSAIKHQDGLIQALTARIEALESKVE